VARPPVARYFLFNVARHLLTDRLRRRRIVSIESVGDFDLSNVLVDEISPERRLDAHQQLKRLAQALNDLPPKCRQVVWMRRVEALSQKQVAERLGVSERTVESHVLKGMYLLKQALYGRAASGKPDEASSTQQTGSEHGRHHTD
jgi:RNA polymerase sigma-70 factor (ECF subfamily)